MSPAGLRNYVVDSLVKASPQLLFLAFGRKSMLGSTAMWQSILYPPIFVRTIDSSLKFLFNWSCRNISAPQKLAAYPHLFSYTSVKSVVHWFQIIRNKSFQMYDDDVQAPLSIGATDRYYKVAKFPTRNIKTPILLVYGGSDSLVDIRVMLKELPKHTVVKEVPHFEHLDFLWGQEVDTLVFPYVFEALEIYAGRDHLKGFPRGVRRALTRGRESSSDELSSSVTAGGESSDVGAAPSGSNHEDDNTAWKHTRPESAQTASPTAPSFINSATSFDGHEDPRTPVRSRLLEVDPPSASSNTKHKRDSSRSSIRSLDSIKHFGKAGISLGPSKATVGGGGSPGAAGSPGLNKSETKNRGRPS